MLDDKTFLTSVAALETAADRLGQQTVTIQTDHLRRLREMAERAGPPKPARRSRARSRCQLSGGPDC